MSAATEARASGSGSVIVVRESSELTTTSAAAWSFSATRAFSWKPQPPPRCATAARPARRRSTPDSAHNEGGTAKPTPSGACGARRGPNAADRNRASTTSRPHWKVTLPVTGGASSSSKSRSGWCGASDDGAVSARASATASRSGQRSARSRRWPWSAPTIATTTLMSSVGTPPAGIFTGSASVL